MGYDQGRAALFCAAAILLVAATPSRAAVLINSNTTINAGDMSIDGEDVTVQGATLTINGVHSFNSLVVELSGVVTHTAGSIDGGVNGVQLTVTTDVSIDGTSVIDLDSRGFAPGAGTGVGASDPSPDSGRGGGGGGHGGVGGTGTGGFAGGAAYGSMPFPDTFGSGGGSSLAGAVAGGAGGGSIRLVVGGTLTVSGAIRSNGGSGAVDTVEVNGGGGGSGGSIRIDVGTLAGTGSISADGGSGGEPGGTPRGGGGAGGRIAIYSCAAIAGPTITAAGGTGAAAGDVGTIVATPTIEDGACEDADPCTEGDTCQAGTCVTGTPVVCTPSDDCHLAGTCDSLTGDCSDPVGPDATPCDDGLLCTTDDECTAGVCAGTPLADCSDHYVTYKSFAPSISGGSQFLPQDWNITVDDVHIDDADADDPENREVQKLIAMLVPVRKNDEADPVTPELKYLRYRLRNASQGVADPPAKAIKHAPRRWELDNQFGTINLESTKLAGLLLPSSAGLADGLDPAPGASHYVCYRVKATSDVTDQTPGGVFASGLQAFYRETLFGDCALLSDGVTPAFAGTAVEGSCLVTLKGPVELCSPANKTAVDPTRTTSAVIEESMAQTDRSILCYHAKLAKTVQSDASAALSTLAIGTKLVPAQAKHVQHREKLGTAVRTLPGNLFPAPLRVDTLKLRSVCVPTDVLAVEALP